MLEVNNVGLSGNGRYRIRSIAFSAAPGTMVAILGPNGAGKSTLLSCLAQPPARMEGEAKWMGQSLGEYARARLAKVRSVFSQRTEISTDFTGREVVMMGRYPHFGAAPSVSDYHMVEAALQATETETLAERPVRQLSGGEQQRLHFARAATQVWDADPAMPEGQPRLLLLDEPLNNLDIRHQHASMAYARAFAARGNVCLVVLHDLNLAAQYADRVLMLCAGRQMAFGPPAEVFSESLLERCYQCPVSVLAHPFQACPVVFFRQPPLS